jgi:23S rRNA pseudouridine955/2504/2580 synthase
LKRMFLHAHRLSFFHPVSHLTMSLESPLPPELTGFLERLELPRVVAT